MGMNDELKVIVKYETKERYRMKPECIDRIKDFAKKDGKTIKQYNCSWNTIYKAFRGCIITAKTARKLCKSFDLKLSEDFIKIEADKKVKEYIY